MSTHARDQSRRYVVRIPFQSSPSILGDSFQVAQKYLNRLKIRLSEDSTYQQLYSSFMNEYAQLGHMKCVRNHSKPTQSGADSGEFIDEITSAHGRRVYYLPHHVVLKTDKVTTKLRIVFNGSSLTTSEHSLNDLQYTGVKLRKDLSDVLI